MRTTLFCLALVFVAALSRAMPAHIRTTNDELKSRLINELKRYYNQSFEITVKDSGAVTIDGVVRSFWDRRKVEAIVSRVDGVRKISNWLGVAVDPVPDRVIKEDIEKQLGHTRAIEDAGKIQVAVNNGAVTLRGSVGFQREADVAEAIAGWCPGVRSVVDDLDISPPEEKVSDAQLMAMIHDLVVRFFPLEKNIYMNVENGVVTLSGSVDKLWELYEIPHEIQNIRGVQDVVNNLMVTEGR